MMAEAFGGKAIKSPKGLGIGLHEYALGAREPWIDSAAPIAAAVSHQDQVVALPPGAWVVGGSDFTPMGVIAYDDQPAISMQCHPEFSPAYAQALLKTRWAERNSASGRRRRSPSWSGRTTTPAWAPGSAAS